MPAVAWSLAASLVVVAAACAGAVLARGSTAVPAACWACAAALALAGEAAARLSGGLADPTAESSVRLVVAALSLCPIMSLLGAKRPQHGVWQFIVGSLAGILALPAASAALVRPGSPPDVHLLQRWFMLVLVLVAAMNFIATRHGLAALLAAVGQAVVIREFLPFAEAGGARQPLLDAAATWLIAAAAVMAVAVSWRWPASRAGAAARGAGRDPLAADLASFNAAYLALRETLGAAWTLRIAERFNAVAESRGWPCRLRFDGLHDDGGDAPQGEWRGDAVRTGRALLRRFVSSAWMRRHAIEPKNCWDSAPRVVSHPSGG